MYISSRDCIFRDGYWCDVKLWCLKKKLSKNALEIQYSSRYGNTFKSSSLLFFDENVARNYLIAVKNGQNSQVIQFPLQFLHHIYFRLRVLSWHTFIHVTEDTIKMSLTCTKIQCNKLIEKKWQLTQNWFVCLC